MALSPALPFALLAVSDRRGLDSLSPWLAGLGDAGVGAVQLREKDLSDRARWALARTARRLLPQTRVLLNGRSDLARAAGLDGVHLPADEIPVAAVRQIAGSPFLVGRSTHTREEVVRAAGEGADYVAFGPVYPTPSKPGAPATGLEGLAAVCSVGVPVLALGGVGEDELEAVAAAGASGMAGIRAFRDRSRLEGLVRRATEVFGKP